MSDLKPSIPAPEWEVSFKVKFHSDMFPGFGYGPMDIVKAFKNDIEKGSVGHYVDGAEFSIDWFKDQPAEDKHRKFRRSDYRQTIDSPDYLRS